MARTKMWRRVLGLVLSVVMLLGMAAPAFATDADSGAVSLESVDNSVISAGLNLRRPDNKLEQEEANFGNVRVSIVLEDKSTIAAGYSTEDIANNASAMAYRAKLENKQDQMARAISAQALGGAKLDVVWNLTLAANIISANVPYQKIDAIKAVPGVADVVLETRYEPAVVSKGGADPNMATSQDMIGSPVAYGLDYTGAGSRIAIIDTGTDTDHQSFDDGAFEKAIVDYAAKKELIDVENGEDFFEAEEALGLLTVSDIQKCWKLLHIYNDPGMPNIKPVDVYLSSKLPFAFNYVDKDLDVTHDKDSQGEHGSHVAGIATANSYIPTGDKKVPYKKALDEVFVQGVAPEAQLITMKVFGKGGGAYDSDYMVAIEDAIVLNCDSINLSLGSASAGSRMSDEYQGILDSLAESDVVVVMSAGNAGTWADEIQGVGLPYLYADDVDLDTVGSPASFANSLAVASVDNTGYTGSYLQVGDNKITYSDSAGSGYGNKPMTTLDTSNDGNGTEYTYIISAVRFTDVEDEDGNVLSTTVAYGTNGIGDEREVKAIGEENLKGKIFICQRGTTSFFEKANAGAGAGAAGTIIYNNTTGTIGLNLTGYEYTAPCVSILQADGLALIRASEAVEDKDGNILYYTGKITVRSKLGVLPGDAEYPYYTMSDFSSWGVPGDLSLKPEITAPGGNIYSVNGLTPGGKDYEQMSGTSMAAPQVTGMVALVAQYLRENYLKNEGDKLPGELSLRQMAQSLLMSTAKPMLGQGDGYAYFYPVFQQGAGLADVGAAVTAHSYITVEDQDDGKVKVELGDDAERTGVYTFNFTLNNLTDAAAEYELSANVFTQYLLSYLELKLLNSTNPFMLDKETDTLPATTTFAGTGVTSATDEDGETIYTASVAANGSVEVTVTITLTEQIKNLYNAYAQYGLTNGAYVEAYVWADEVAAAAPADAEGVEPVLTSHSIPVLGFYGNWSDASMYDRVSYMEIVYDVFDGIHFPYLPSGNSFNLATNYITANSKSEGQYILGGNPLAEEIPEFSNAAAANAYYLQEMGRSALNNNGDKLATLTFANIRNAGNAVFQVVDATSHEVYYRSNDLGPVTAAYYSANQGAWQSINKNLNLNWAGTKQVTGDDGEVTEVKLDNGTQVLVQLVLAPELYGKITKDEDGIYSDEYDWDELAGENGTLGEGAYLEFPLTIDTAVPYDVSVTRGTTDEDENILTVSAKDNGYIAAIAIYNEDGTRCLAMVDPNIDPETGAAVPQTSGEAVSVDIDMGGAYGTRFYVAVYDYALNQATYRFNESFNEVDYSGTIMFQDGAKQWSVYDGESESKEPSKLMKAQTGLTAAAYVDGYIFGTDEEGNLCVTDPGNLDVVKTITNIGVSFEDMTYNADDEMLYGIAYVVVGRSVYNVLCSVDKLTGEADIVMDLYDIGLYDPTTIACDGNGTFYSLDNGDGHLYSYTLDDEEATDLGKMDRRFNDAGTLEYDGGKLYWAHYVDEPPYFDLNGDGKTDEKDTQFILEYAVGNLSAQNAAVIEAYADFNGDGAVTTADAQLLLSYINEQPVGHLVEIDLTGEAIETKTVFSLNGPLNAIIFPKTQTGEPAWKAEAQNVASVVLEQDKLDIIVNESAQLTAYVTPWTLSEANKAVTWTSSDTSVATVDENGVVTGVGEGTAQITAASAVDATVTSEACTVTVTAINYTLNGALQDENGEAKFYTYDLTSSLAYGLATGGARAIASTTLASDGNVYVADDVDGSYGVHKVDPATGEDVDSYAGIIVPLCDIATSTEFKGEDDIDLLNSIYGAFLFPMQPVDSLSRMGYNLGTVLGRYTGASEFVAIASGGDDEVEDDDTGEVLPAEWIWAVDNAGYVWYLDLTEEGDLYLGNFFPINFPGETPSFQGYSEANYCSLVESDDDEYLFLTTFNEDYGTDGTSEIYMLTMKTDGNKNYWFDARCVGNVGDGVWPATLYSVEANGASEGDDTSATLRETVSALGHEPLATMTAQDMVEMVVEETQSTNDDVKASRPSVSEAVEATGSELDGIEQPQPVGGSLMSVSFSAGESSEGTVGADVTVENSSNGLIEVTYDADALTLDKVTANLPKGALYAVNKKEAGKVVLAYASLEKLDGTFHLAYTFDEETAPYKSTVTVKTVEENDELPDASSDVIVTLKEEPVELPDVPVTPDSGTTPGADPIVKDNEDGSTTTTVTDPETGTVTETTEQPDGTVEVVETKEDGTVTETTTDPEGGKVEKVTDPEQNVTITVTDAEGEVLVEVKLPAEVPETETRFDDVPENHWADEAIHNMAALGIVNGVGDNLFDMNSPMTRGMLATVLFRLSNGKAGYDLSFSDVSENAYYSDAVAWAAKVGVVNGISEDRFAPNNAISREQMVTMLYRYAKLMNLDTTVSDDALNAFADAGEVSGWAEEAMAWCVENGIINGVSSDTLDPGGVATRAQVALIFERFLALMK